MIVYLLRHDAIIDLMPNLMMGNVMVYCTLLNLPMVKKGMKICIDVSKTNIKCFKCLNNRAYDKMLLLPGSKRIHSKRLNILKIKKEAHSHNTIIDHLDHDVKLIKEMINLPNHTIRTCLVKNNGDLVKTIELLEIEEKLQKDIEFIKNTVNVPKHVIQTCLVKNKYDIEKTISQLQSRQIHMRKSERIAGRRRKGR